jgi:hypothetical protein
MACVVAAGQRAPPVGDETGTSARVWHRGAVVAWAVGHTDAVNWKWAKGKGAIGPASLLFFFLFYSLDFRF